jgi:hypothetical protein
MAWFVAITLLSTLICTNSATATNRRLTRLDEFSNPSARYRPKFRYWIPDASVDPERVKADIASAGAQGAGGVEVLGYYWYGNFGSFFPVPVDWVEYGWGTESWSTVLAS